MNAIKAIVRGGRIELEKPLDLPDGTELLIPMPQGNHTNEEEDQDWDNSPEGIAEWFQWYDSLEPLIFTPEEEADTEAWLKKINDYTVANMDKGIKDLFLSLGDCTVVSNDSDMKSIPKLKVENWRK